MNAPILINEAPRRAALRWHGGKWRLAPWIISHFPKHRIYVEPFGGAGSVLLRKARTYAEVYNDLDDEVVGLFRVLRDPTLADALEQALRLTPFSRVEFRDSYEPGDDADPVERARRLIVRAYMGFGSNAHATTAVSSKNGFRNHTRAGAGDPGRATGFRSNANRSGTTPAHDWANYPAVVPAFVARLAGVIIEHRDAVEVMRQHDGVGTLHYVDPPYVHATRSLGNRYDLKHRMYRFELDDAAHLALLDALNELAGYVVLSGYPSPLYEAPLAGWRMMTCDALADGARPRTEAIWLNPRAAAALDRESHALRMPLFATCPPTTGAHP